MSIRRSLPLLCAVLLAGCGPVHPGQAAVVGNRQISLDQADATARVYCAFIRHGGAAGQPVPYAAVRRQAVTDLVFAVIADDLAADRHIDTTPDAFSLTPQESAAVRRAVPRRQVAAALAAAGRNARTLGIAEHLGAKPGRSDLAAREAGFRIIERVARRDAHFDPRFDLGDDAGRSLSILDESFHPPTGPDSGSAVEVCQV